jgi:hypothetical protein
LNGCSLAIFLPRRAHPYTFRPRTSPTMHTRTWTHCRRRCIGHSACDTADMFCLKSKTSSTEYRCVAAGRVSFIADTSPHRVFRSTTHRALFQAMGRGWKRFHWMILSSPCTLAGLIRLFLWCLSCCSPPAERLHVYHYFLQPGQSSYSSKLLQDYYFEGSMFLFQ